MSGHKLGLSVLMAWAALSSGWVHAEKTLQIPSSSPQRLDRAPVVIDRDKIKPIAGGGGGETGAMVGMTAAHNKARSDVGKNIPPLTWSSQLAAYATEWAQTLAKDCKLKHRSNSPYGENLAGGSGSYKAQDIVAMWVSEKAKFDHATKKCKTGNAMDCGHYTQVIWKNTTKLGCGYATCAGGGGTVWVCNYDPPGNYTGQAPY